MVGCFLLLLLTGILSGEGSSLAKLTGPLVGICFIAAIVVLLKRGSQGKYDLDDRKLETVVRSLTMIAADTPRTTIMRLMVDFRDYQKGGELTSKDQPGFFSSAPKVLKYAHEWLTLEGELADGSNYRLGVSDSVTRKEKRKRKYTKVKASTRGVIVVQLKLKPARYGDAAALAASLQSAPPPPGSLELRGASANGRTLRVALRTQPSLTVTGRGTQSSGESNILTGDTVLQAMLWIYDTLGRARSAAA